MRILMKMKKKTLDQLTKCATIKSDKQFRCQTAWKNAVWFTVSLFQNWIFGKMNFSIPIYVLIIVYNGCIVAIGFVYSVIIRVLYGLNMKMNLLLHQVNWNRYEFIYRSVGIDWMTLIEFIFFRLNSQMIVDCLDTVFFPVLSIVSFNI